MPIDLGQYWLFHATNSHVTRHEAPARPMRFFASVKAFTHAFAARLTQIDCAHAIA
jgi:hypothetical protein